MIVKGCGWVFRIKGVIFMVEMKLLIKILNHYIFVNKEKLREKMKGIKVK